MTMVHSSLISAVSDASQPNWCSRSLSLSAVPIWLFIGALAAHRIFDGFGFAAVILLIAVLTSITAVIVARRGVDDAMSSGGIPKEGDL